MRQHLTYLFTYLSVPDAQHAVVTFRLPALLPTPTPTLLTLLPAFVPGSNCLPAVHGRSTTAAVEYQFRLFLQLLWPCFAFVNLDFHGGCVFWDSRLQRLSFFPSREDFAKCSVVPGKWVCGRLVPVLKRCTCLFFALWAFRCRLLTNVFAGVGWDGRSACIQNQRLYTKPAVVYKTSGYISIPYHIISIYAYHIISWLHYFPLKPVCVVSPAKKIGWWWRFFIFILYFNSFVAVRSVTFDDGGRSSCMLWSILSQFFVYILFSYTV